MCEVFTHLLPPTIRVTVSMYWALTMYYSRQPFLNFLSFNPQNCPFSLFVSSPFYRWENWGQLNGAVEKAMAAHSSTLAWKIPWTEEPGGLQSMGSLRVRHDWTASLSLFTFTHWRRQWQPTPVFLPRESLGWGSLVGCHLWGRTESDTTEAT